jgi:hypothetical protein
MARDLKRRGWRFVGPTTAYAFQQAMGLVDDHLVGCHARRALIGERIPLRRPPVAPAPRPAEPPPPARGTTVFRRRRRKLGVQLEVHPDDLPKTGLFAEPVRVESIKVLDPEVQDDGQHRVTFLVEVRDAEDKRCSNLAVEAGSAAPSGHGRCPATPT